MTSRSVRIGSRDVIVERSPLPVHYLSAGVHEKFALWQPNNSQLCIQPSTPVRVIGWVFCVLGWPPLALGALLVVQQILRLHLDNLLAVMFLLAWGGAFSLLSIKLLGRRCRFDSGSGELTIRQLLLLRSVRRPLTAVMAVQVINAGKFGNDQERFISYQLNLVLDDQNEPRLFVVYNSDFDDMVAKAKQLADFLQVPLLAPPAKKPRKERAPRPTTAQNVDPTGQWSLSREPLPPIDVEAGSVGNLTLGDPIEEAEFLGRPDRVEHTSATGMTLHYLDRGFELQFSEGEFVELRCHIAPWSDNPPDPAPAFSRPRLTDGIQITPEMSIAQVRQVFGPPTSEDVDEREQSLTYAGEQYMVFEFERTSGRLISWSVF